MARVELLDAASAPISVQQHFSRGDPGPIIAALALVPELVTPTLGFVSAALGPGAASTRHKEFAILRTSALQGCRYCVETHSAVSLDVGLTTDEIRALREELPLTEVFSDPGELALLRWVDAVAGSTGPIDSRLYDEVRRWWSQSLLIELTVTIGATIFLNRFATGFELPTSPGNLVRLTEAGL